MRQLTGWGRTAPTAATVLDPDDETDVAAALLAESPSGRGLIARGLGRSYNDAAQNAGGRVADLTGLKGLVDLDPATGVARVRAGTSLVELLEQIVPAGWFVPVSPGTKDVTVGGAVAADIHGKNHHRHGSLGRHVERLVLVDGTGTRRELTPATTPRELTATFGAMGLTGVVVEADLRLLPIGSSLLSVDTDRADDLDELIELMSDGDDDYDYSVAWLDVLAPGRSLGRGILTRANFAAADRLPARRRRHPLAYRTPPRVPAPPVPVGLVNRLTTRAFNEAWFRKAPARRRNELQSIERYFYPLDGLAGWNRLYGPSGFVQWQCVVPFGAEDALRHVIHTMAEHRTPSFLSVLKRFGPGLDAPLSFPMAGWTLAVDVPAALDGLAALLDRLDDTVVGAGGRLYLAKDARVRPELVPVMYPRLGELADVRAELDPKGVLRSDLARRLGL